MAAIGELVDYYPWVDKNLPLVNGKKRSKRSAQALAKRYDFPIVRIGWNAFIDIEKAAERLRQAQLADRTPRGPGRPAKSI
jgi:hypothetical protein